MKNEYVNGLQSLLADMKETALNLPVVIGGIAVNKVTAYQLSQQFGIPVHYGHDLNDAEAVLNRALSGGAVDIPTIKKAERISLPKELDRLAASHSMKLYAINISDIVIAPMPDRAAKIAAGSRKCFAPSIPDSRGKKRSAKAKNF